MDGVLEKDIQADILAWLKAEVVSRGRLFVRRLPLGPIVVARTRTARSPLKGMPDILVCYRSRWISLEVKKNKNIARKDQEHQREVMAEIQDAEGIAVQVDSVADVAKILDRIDRQEARR